MVLAPAGAAADDARHLHFDADGGRHDPAQLRMEVPAQPADAQGSIHLNPETSSMEAACRSASVCLDADAPAQFLLKLDDAPYAVDLAQMRRLIVASDVYGKKVLWEGAPTIILLHKI